MCDDMSAGGVTLFIGWRWHFPFRICSRFVEIAHQHQHQHDRVDVIPTHLENLNNEERDEDEQKKNGQQRRNGNIHDNCYFPFNQMIYFGWKYLKPNHR